MTRCRGLAVTALLLLSATPLAAQRSARRVLDRAAITAAGWHRVGDIAAALPPGAAASLDGFNYELRGSRLGFFQTTEVRATWLVRLDGQTMPMQLGGTWILDNIPVAMTQIDSIVIIEGPSLTDGRAALLGTIDLYTRRPRGMSIVGDYQHGDESGDPGPYRYTPRTTPNVEKLGPFTSGALASGSATASLDFAARYSSLNVTDERIFSRTGGFQSDVNASGGSGVATIDMAGGRTYVLGGRGRFTGFLPLSTVTGNEQARVIATHGGVSGSVSALDRTWRYAASATELELGQLGTVALLLPDTRRRFIDAFVEGDIAAGVRAGLGAAAARRTTTTERREEPSARGWIGYAGPSASADIALERSAGELRVSSAARIQRIVGDSDRLELAATRLEAWRFADGLWMDEGGIDSSEVSALDLRVNLATSPFMRTQPTWYARAFRYSGVGARNVQGLAAGVTAMTTEHATTSVRFRAEVTQLLDDIGPGERSTPAGYVEGMISHRVAGGFRLALSGRYAPRTHWSGSLEDVPVVRRIDLSVNKAMWRDRIRAQLVMRNLLNAAERTHPEGAQWNLRTHLAVTVALPSGAGER